MEGFKLSLKWLIHGGHVESVKVDESGNCFLKSYRNIAMYINGKTPEFRRLSLRLSCTVSFFIYSILIFLDCMSQDIGESPYALRKNKRFSLCFLCPLESLLVSQMPQQLCLLNLGLQA